MLTEIRTSSNDKFPEEFNNLLDDIDKILISYMFDNPSSNQAFFMMSDLADTIREHTITIANNKGN